jgi:hypothetical protein
LISQIYDFQHLDWTIGLLIFLIMFGVQVPEPKEGLEPLMGCPGLNRGLQRPMESAQKARRAKVILAVLFQ